LGGVPPIPCKSGIKVLNWPTASGLICFDDNRRVVDRCATSRNVGAADDDSGIRARGADWAGGHGCVRSFAIAETGTEGAITSWDVSFSSRCAESS
jgi:hypothetical protein